MMGRPGGGMIRAAGMGRPGLGQPPERSKDLRGTVRRLLARMRPERVRLVIVLVFGVTSVALLVTGPKILGAATNVLFDGVVGKQLPAGVTKEQAVALLRAHGQGQLADMISGMNITPGTGVDITQLGRILGLAALVYLLGAAFGWGQGFIMAGVTQRTMYGLRREVEEKLARLPLRYFDSHPHGDILSRVTNDIDNLSTTLQQGLNQLLTSVLTIIGVMGMMFWISPLLEETHTGHALVQVFGRRGPTIDEFGRQNQQLYQASFRAQFLSGVIQPSMQFLANRNYVVIAVLGGYWVASGRISLGDVTAFIQYSRQFTMPITQIASQMNMLQSGLASAERVFEFLDAPEEAADRAPAAGGPGAARPSQVAGRVTLGHVFFRYQPDKPLIEDFTLEVAPGQTIAIVG